MPVHQGIHCPAKDVQAGPLSPVANRPCRAVLAIILGSPLSLAFSRCCSWPSLNFPLTFFEKLKERGREGMPTRRTAEVLTTAVEVATPASVTGRRSARGSLLPAFDGAEACFCDMSV